MPITTLPDLSLVKAAEITLFDNLRPINHKVLIKLWVGSSRMLIPQAGHFKVMAILWNYRQAHHELTRIKRRTVQITRSLEGLLKSNLSTTTKNGFLADKTCGTTFLHDHITQMSFDTTPNNEKLIINILDSSGVYLSTDQFSFTLADNSSFAKDSQIVCQARLTNDAYLKNWATGPLTNIHIVSNYDSSLYSVPLQQPVLHHPV